ncbi:MAG: hypothetical protein ABI742_14600, partial [Gemmatimonadota bacterium]
DTVDIVERHDLRQRPSRIEPWPLAKHLWREGGRLRIRADRPKASKRDAASRPAEDPDLEEVTR